MIMIMMGIVYVNEPQMQQLESFYQMDRESLYQYLDESQDIQLVLVDDDVSIESEFSIIYR